MAFRFTPVTLYLCGAPKIGKSHLVLPISKYFNEKLFNATDFVFPLTVVRDHWDGYKQQPIVVLDDHYKKQDDKQEIDAGVVMNIVSCTAFLPNFDLAHFKMMAFTSQILIINSNFGYPSTIYLPDALHRRHKHHVIVIHNGLPLNVNFSHLNFFYTHEIIDPFAGLYTYPFNKLHDIPYTMSEFNLFPFRNRYRKVSLLQLCEIVVNDYNASLTTFNTIKDFSI